MKRNCAAPGPDGLFNIIFKKLPCLHDCLIILFDRIRVEKSYPQSLKHGRVVLVHKKNDPSLVKNFRPICLTDAISKIFTQYLVIHASRHMRFNNYMSKTQKGFLEDVSGCVEHQFLLEFSINKARKIGRSDVILVMTDLINAFGSVRHKLIEFALKHYHFSQDFIELILDMYKDLSISLKIQNESQVIPQKIGVFQGDPLSPILFDIVINMILEPLNYPQIVKKTWSYSI